MKSKNSRFRIKSSDHEFDLWFFGELLYEAVRLDNVKGFNNLIDSNPELADEYFVRHVKKIKKVELPTEFNMPEWKEKMLVRIYKTIKMKKV